MNVDVLCATGTYEKKEIITYIFSKRECRVLEIYRCDPLCEKQCNQCRVLEIYRCDPLCKKECNSQLKKDWIPESLSHMLSIKP